MTDLVHPDFRETVRQRQAEIARTGAPAPRIEERLMGVDGREIVAEVAATQVRFGGEPALQLALQDVTRRHAAEAALRQSEAKYRHLASVVSDVIWVLDVGTGLFQYVSPSVERVLGFRVDDVIGAGVDRVLAPADAARVGGLIADRVSEFAAAERDGVVLPPVTLEVDQLRREGPPVPTEVVATSVVNPTTGRIEIHGITRDITERRRQAEDLARSRRNLNEAQRLAGLGSFEYDVRRHTLYWSDGLLRIFGITRGEFGGTMATYYSRVHPDDLARIQAEIAHAFETGFEGDMEHRLIRADGEVRHVVNTVAVEREHGVPVRAYGSVKDVTEERRSAAEQVRLEAQLLQAQKMESVGRLAGGVAHDFNNMLGVILGHLELALEQVPSGAPIRGDLEAIRKAAEHSADLTRQLLAFARKQTVTPKVLDLNETVGGTLKMIATLIGENIRLEWRPGSPLWPVRIDPSQVEQIVTNLCVNARDAIGLAGAVTVATENLSLGEDAARRANASAGDYATLTVIDNGSGMDAETAAHVFEPFFTTKGSGGGTGLGLATVYGAVTQNGGFVEVRSEPGAGTTFTVALPRHLGTADAEHALPAVPPAAPGRETILLVEDEPALLTLAERLLAAQGHTVLAAGSPAEALRLAREHRGDIHLLLTDVVMPEMNGRDLARNLLAMFPRMRRLFMSGYTADVIAHHSIVEPGVHFIQKPFRRDGLLAAVRTALDAD